MYARLTPTGIELESHPATRPGAVLFADLNVDHDGSVPIAHVVAAIEQLRELSPSGLGNISTVLFRWPQLAVASSVIDESDLGRVWQQVDELFERMNISALAGLVCAPLGASPTITWGPDSLAPADRAGPGDDMSGYCWKEWLLACREVELTALLQHGRGIWRPRHYHYRLPSGRHSATFVRLGDAVRSVRDADVLAWWLHEHAAEDLGVVLDTSTIVPIILALRNSMAMNGLRLGKTVSLASYPATRVEFRSSVGRAHRGGNPVLALLSVNSSGSVRDRLLSALSANDNAESEGAEGVKGEPLIWSQHTFVDKMGTNVHHLDTSRSRPDDRTSVWSSQGERAEMVPEDCRLCHDPSRSRTVQIDPKSFDGLVLPDPVLVTPDIRVADSARVFWHLCDQTGALTLDDDPHESVARVRPHGGRMGVVIEYDDLLREQVALEIAPDPNDPEGMPTTEALEPISELIAQVEERLDRQHRENDESARISSREAIDFIKSAELVVGLDSEFGRAHGGGRKLATQIIASWNDDDASDRQIIEFSLTDEQKNRKLESTIRSATNVCIFVLDVVTGTSLHLILAWIQEIRRKSGLGRCEVGVFVLHFRPSSWRARAVISNPFGDDRFVAAFESVLPDGPSPLAVERKLLEEYELVDSISSMAYFQKRLRFLRGEADSPGGEVQNNGIFWGLREGSEVARLRPGSLFGERLTAKAALMAVGSGIQRRRHHDQDLGEIPEWRQFEIPAIFASYFDCLIVCSILRWLEKEECWWGREVGRSGDVIESLLNQHTNLAERVVILGELLLASVMGKIPNKAIDVIIDKSVELVGEAEAVRDSTDGGVDIEPLRLGLALLDPKNAQKKATVVPSA